MNLLDSPMTNSVVQQTGVVYMIKQKYPLSHYIGVFGLVLILLWLGIYKFTATEAAEIEPLVAYHPLMSWMYEVMSLQTVSNVVGFAEIIVGVALIVGLFVKRVGYWSGIAAAVIFVVTISFIFTTPDMWEVIEGVPLTDFFLLKDILMLAVAISVVERNR